MDPEKCDDSGMVMRTHYHVKSAACGVMGECGISRSLAGVNYLFRRKNIVDAGQCLVRAAIKDFRKAYLAK